MEINKCKLCNSDAYLKTTFGGNTPYYAIHCKKCNNNSRGMGNLLPMMFSNDVCNTPQKTEKEAVETWNK